MRERERPVYVDEGYRVCVSELMSAAEGVTWF